MNNKLNNESNDVLEIEDTFTFGEDLFMKEESKLIRATAESELHISFAKIADHIQFCRKENVTPNEQLERKADVALNQLVAAHAAIMSLYNYRPDTECGLKESITRKA